MADSGKAAEARKYLETISNELDRVVDFWTKHSHDKEIGYANTDMCCSPGKYFPLVPYSGFFNCLSRTGEVYDTSKYAWLQGRQVWMYTELYRKHPRFKRRDILEEAIKGRGTVVSRIGF